MEEWDVERGNGKEERGMKGSARTRERAKQKNSPLVPDAGKLCPVGRVRLHAQAGRQDKLTDGGAEAGEEGVERLWRRTGAEC